MSASSSPELADEFEISSYDVAGFAANALRDRQSLAAVLDHTLLKPDATSADIVRLCEEAMHYRFACVSVNPCWIALAHSALSGSGVAVGSVVGFPFGASLTHNKREEGESALRLGARELDMVIHIGALKGGDNATVQSDVRTMVELAHDAGSTLKAILETCLLTLEEKLRASEICVAAGVDFLKTSTGFSTGGAIVKDVSLLRGVAGGRCGVKAAGGIRTLDSVRDMLEAGASRIGTSSGVAILESYMEQQRAVESYLSGQSAALSK